ncbi:MAG: hypothetical protein AABX34_04230 [Nanoarchaeota archaeon]
MTIAKISAFEVVLLIVGITSAILGFKLISMVHSQDGTLSWMMVIAIFNWLTLLVLFISLSLAVDVSKKQLTQMEEIVNLLGSKKKK